MVGSPKASPSTVILDFFIVTKFSSLVKLTKMFYAKIKSIEIYTANTFLYMSSM